MEYLSRFGQHLFDVARRVGLVQYEAGERQKTFALRERFGLLILALFFSVSSSATSVFFMLILGPRNSTVRYWDSLEKIFARLEETLVMSNVGITVYLLTNAFAQISGLLLSTSLKGEKLTKLRPGYLVQVSAGLSLLTWYFFLANWEIGKIVYALLTIGISSLIFVVTAHIDMSKRE
jgi:hypothetical protein